MILTPESVAEYFHTVYEQLAPEFGYRTREESAVPWADVPPVNKELMTAVSAAVIALFAEEKPRPELPGPALPSAADVARVHNSIKCVACKEGRGGTGSLFGTLNTTARYLINYEYACGGHAQAMDPEEIRVWETLRP